MLGSYGSNEYGGVIQTILTHPPKFKQNILNSLYPIAEALTGYFPLDVILNAYLDMNTTTLNIVQGDFGYPLSFTLKDNTGAAVDLTGAVVNFLAQLSGNSSIKVSGEMDVISAVGGTCSYTVQETDFDAEGSYKAEISLVYPDETVSFVNIVIIAAPKLPAA